MKFWGMYMEIIWIIIQIKSILNKIVLHKFETKLSEVNARKQGDVKASGWINAKIKKFKISTQS